MNYWPKKEGGRCAVRNEKGEIEVCTQKILGFMVSGNLRAKANVDALMMAIKENGAPCYHHSDYGGQCT